jgi:hypothetical protein
MSEANRPGGMIKRMVSGKLTNAMKNETDIDSKIDEAESPASTQLPLVDGLDYYLENGLMVFTAHFLRRRGYCCDNGCRHCPYEKGEPLRGIL